MAPAIFHPSHQSPLVLRHQPTPYILGPARGNVTRVCGVRTDCEVRPLDWAPEGHYDLFPRVRETGDWKTRLEFFLTGVKDFGRKQRACEMFETESFGWTTATLRPDPATHLLAL